MSIVTIQLGQCGNQIGYDFFNLLANDASIGSLESRFFSSRDSDYRDEVVERFFVESESKGNVSLNARAVLVDTEPKVINQCVTESEKSGKWSFSRENTFQKKQGSGNNWAQGYQRYGLEVAQEISNLARKEVEKCDLLGGFLVTMSLAGGTGSGLGTCLTHTLNDDFEDTCIVNNVIWPYSAGEVIVQNYNTILSLSHLHQSSDAIIVMENDHLNKICMKLLKLKNVSFDDVNKVISHKIASVLQPAYSSTSTFARSNALQNIVEDLCSHPSYKLLAIKNIPQMSEKSMEYATFVWPALMKHLKQMLIADAALEEGIDWKVKVPAVFSRKETRTGIMSPFNKSVANSLILRGKDCSIVSFSDFENDFLYPSWMPRNSRLSVWHQEKSFNRYEKSATLISNSQSFVKPLNSVIDKAWNMFASRAYIHQYTRYGLTDDDFVDSFGCLEQILSDYQCL